MTHERYVGVATDGAAFVVYELQDGRLSALKEFHAETENAHGRLLELSSVVVAAEEIRPEPDVVRAQLGRGSVAWIRARNDMRRMYVEVGSDPEVRTKRALWSQLLARVYGSPVDDDLFFQHTYLTAIAKTMAAHVIGVGNPSPADLLSGRLFEQANLYGVAESDFFDWVLLADGGEMLVERIALWPIASISCTTGSTGRWMRSVPPAIASGARATMATSAPCSASVSAIRDRYPGSRQ